MNAPPSRWQEIDALFEATLERDPEERERFLAGLDVELRREVENLVRADEAARSFLEGRPGTWLAEALLPATAAKTVSPASLAGGGDLPKRIGPYKVLGVIGEGGMGRVLLASRADEQYQRLVAIKTLRARLPGALRQELLARFDLERQALAQLEHPNIARLYDAGRDEDGDPYLVLEHIDGVPIDEYCDQHRLDARARLRLFAEVCQAVQVAHRNLLVHRDLKPSNILVTREGRPMLLDFGIAKLLDPARIAGEVLETRSGSRPMTPGYASPEQVKGEPITTASDVYSLGVLLYELLTGRKPYRVTSWLPHELEKAICELEPERPSTAVFRDPSRSDSRGAYDSQLAPVEVAARRGTSPTALARLLRGDLDTLLQTALRKDPNQRYASVEALVQDIHAFLEGRPLAARPPSTLYNLRKFVRRHRFGVATAGSLAALLLFFLGALMLQAREIRAERDKAQQALDFLVEVFKASDPSRAQGEELKAREILDGAARRISRELENQPEIQATLMDAMGQVYYSLGLNPEARQLLTAARDRRLATLGENHPDTLLTRAHLGRVLIGLREQEAARLELEKAIALRDPDAAEDLAYAELISDLASVEEWRQGYDAAILLRRRAAAIVESLDIPFHQRLESQANLIGALLQARRFEELDPLLARLKEETGELMNAESANLETAASLANVGELLWQFGDPRAETLLRRALDLRRRYLTEDHPLVVRSVMQLAFFLDFEGRYEEALAYDQPAYDSLRAQHGREDRRTLDLETNVAVALARLGRTQESLPLMLHARDGFTRLLGDRAMEVATSWLSLGGIYRVAGNFAEAERCFEESAKRHRLFSPEQVDLSRIDIGYSRLRRDQKNYPEAIAYFQKALATRLARLGERDWQYAYFRGEYADLLVEAGRFEEAEQEAVASYQTLRTYYGPQTAMVKKPMLALIALYRKQGRLTEAQKLENAVANPDLRPEKLGP